MFTAKEIHQLAQICQEAAQQEILPRFRSLVPSEIEQKANINDLVTVADQAAERLILQRLAEYYPNALLIGEESVYEDKAALAEFNDAELAFVLDPIDGTYHFAYGSSGFGTILGVSSHGEMIAGLIYEPVTGDYLWTIKGQGAFQRAHGKDFTLECGHQTNRALNQTMGSFSFGFHQGEQRQRALRAVMAMGRVMDYRCAATEYRLLTSGATAFVIFQGVLNLWDHAVGLLLTHEAGGYARLMDGSPYTPQAEGMLLIAESEARWHEVAALFND